MVAEPSCLALSTIAWKAGSTLVAVVAPVEALDACGFDLPELPQAPATMAMASTIVTDANVNLDGRDIAIRLPLWCAAGARTPVRDDGRLLARRPGKKLLPRVFLMRIRRRDPSVNG